jgi:uncharacterized membrane protein
MEDLLKLLITNLAVSIEATAGVMLRLGTLQGIWQAIVLDFKHKHSSEELTEEIRLQFYRGLSLAIELVLAVDVLRIAISLEWTQIGQLGAVGGNCAAPNGLKLLFATGNRSSL